MPYSRDGKAKYNNECKDLRPRFQKEGNEVSKNGQGFHENKISLILRHGSRTLRTQPSLLVVLALLGPSINLYCSAP